MPRHIKFGLLMTGWDYIWAKWGSFLSRAITGGSFVAVILYNLSEYLYLLPQDWLVFGFIVLGSSFLLGYRTGFYIAFIFFGIFAVIGIGAHLGLLFVTLAYVLCIVVNGLSKFIIWHLPGMSRRFDLDIDKSSKEVVLMMFSPLLFASSLGFTVPILSGILFGRRGVATSVSSCIFISVVFAAFGLFPWAFPIENANSFNLLTKLIPLAGSGTLMDIYTQTNTLPNQLENILILSLWHAFWTGFASIPLLWTQVALWGICALFIALMSERSTALGGKILAVLAGSLILFVGYAVLPIVLGDNLELVIEGGTALFMFYFATSVSICLAVAATVPSASGIHARQLGAVRKENIVMGDPTADIGSPPQHRETSDSKQEKHIKIEL